MLLKIKFILKILVIIFVCIITSLLIISFFFNSKKKEAFDERKYKNERKSHFYQPGDMDMILKNAAVTAAIYYATITAPITLGLSLLAIPFLLNEIIVVYDARTERALRLQVLAVKEEIEYDKVQIVKIDNSMNIISSTINGYATQIKSHAKTLEKQIEKMNVQLPSIYDSKILLNTQPNDSMIGTIHANIQDLRVYLNMIINEDVLTNMKKDLKDEKKANNILGYLVLLTKNINSRILTINKMIIEYVPKIIPKDTPKDITKVLSDFNNMKPNFKKILTNIELINNVMTYFMTIYLLKKFYLKEIADDNILHDSKLIPFKKRRFKNARW